MKNFFKIFSIIIFFIGTFYLVLPAPKDFPDLPNSVKSIEPGDTTQIANIKAYYTNTPRKDVVNFYTRYFSKSPFRGITLINYRLNQPPERIREVLRSTQQSTYVEEVIHPFRESVFINGFEWNNDPFTKPERRIKNILEIDGKVYQFKVTLFYQESKIWQRLLIFYLSLISIYLLCKVYQGIWFRWKKER